MRGLALAALAAALAACATVEAGTVTLEDVPTRNADMETARTMELKMSPVTMTTTAPDRLAMNAVIERVTGKPLQVPRTAFRDSPRLVLQEAGAPGRDVRMPSEVVTHSFRLVSGDMGCALQYEATGETFPLDGVRC